MLNNSLYILIGNLIFLYIFWKKLKEDYTSEIIFTSAFYILAGMVLGLVFALKIKTDLWFWLSFVGLVIGFSLTIIKYKLRLMETVEAVVIAVLPSLVLIFLSDSIRNQSYDSFFQSILTLILIILFFIFDKHYKKFTWYKSGRIGFSGLTTLGLFFLLRALVANWFPFMLSFFGKKEVYLSASMAFVSFLGLFNLTRQKT